MCRMFWSLLLSWFAISVSHAIVLERQQEPTEGAFSMQLPQGWQTQLGLSRRSGSAQTWVYATGPEPGNQWFVGDPNLTFFMDPRGLDPQLVGYMQMGGTAIAPMPLANQFVRDYITRRFGGPPGGGPVITIERVGELPEVAQSLRATQSQMGRDTQVTAAFVEFRLAPPNPQKGSQPGRQTLKPIRGRVAASVMGMSNPMGGLVWTPLVTGFITTDSFTQHRELFETAEASLTLDPAWQAREQQRQAQANAAMAQRNQQRMQQSQAAHQQRMATMNQSFQAHQRSMADRSAMQDQQHANYMNNSNLQQQGHNNYIRGAIHENTLVNGGNGGPSYEVGAGNNYYYVNPYERSYIGTDAPIDVQDVPDGYRQMEEQR